MLATYAFLSMFHVSPLVKHEKGQNMAISGLTLFLRMLLVDFANIREILGTNPANVQND